MTLKKIKLTNESNALYARLGDLHDTGLNREMGDLEGLRHSISEVGLICPLAIDERGKLLAGRRRFAAVTELEWEMVPVIVFPTVDEVTALQIMIDENMKRRNLTDPEHAAFVKQLHEVKQRQEYQKVIVLEVSDSEKSTEVCAKHIPVEKSTLEAIWPQEKTAKLLGVNRGTISKAITIAEEVEKNPKLASQTGTTILRAVRREKAVQDLVEKGIEKKPDHLSSGNLWYFNDRDPRFGIAKHKHGVVPGQAIENLLWVYTNKGDLVIDPMAGGGTVLDVCKLWQRPCLSYDIDVVRDGIIHNDIWKGLPKECKDAKFIYLDPPYYNMIQNAYKDANAYFKFQDHIIDVAANTVQIGGYVAYIIMEYSDRDENGMRYGVGKSLIGEVYRALQDHPSLVFEASISVPIPQAGFRYTPFEIVKTKHNLVGLNRIIWVAKKIAV